MELPLINNDSSDSVKYGRYLANSERGEDVVISGFSGKFPKSNNIQDFSQNLFNGVDMITDESPRWKRTYPEIPKRRGKISCISKFDAGYFGFSYKRSTSSDPVIRKCLEATVEAIFDAGLHPSDLEGTKTGVYVCNSFVDSSNYWYFKDPKSKFEPILGCAQSMIAHQLSYFLKLRGPSYVIDSACSSSLYAIEHAFKAIRNGECDTAIVAGGNICMQPLYTLQFVRLGVLSPNGICKPFDADAEGYVRSEMISACILQKSKDAKRVYCKIVHAKTNCDGFKETGITFPSAKMQTQLLKEVYEECLVNPSDISYFEAHGTGTKVGDPVELKVIEDVFLRDGKNLLIGSTKSNIGHTESGSGLASIAKVIIAMESGYIPPNIGFKNPTKESKALINGRLKMVTKKIKFGKKNGLIAINNFGFGGSNSHIVLQPNTKTKPTKIKKKGDVLRMVCVSGRTKEAVNDLLDSVAKYNNIEHMRLLQDIFKKNIEGHYYRGYILLNNHGEIARSSRFYYLQRTELYISFGEIVRTGSFLNELLEIPVFSSAVNRILEIKKKLNTYPGNKFSFNIKISNLLEQLGIIEVFKLIKLKIKGIFGNDVMPVLNELLYAYYTDILNLEDTVELAYSTIWMHSNKILTNSLDQDLKIRKEIHQKMYSKIQPVTANCCVSKSNSPKPHTKTNTEILQIGDMCIDMSNILLQQMKNVTITSCLGIVDLLAAFGRVFESGQDLHIHNLFPPIEFPVSRGTPMISPDIRWNHDRDWFVAKYDIKEKDCETYGISLEDHDWAFLEGYNIDGAIMIPASAYLVMAWKTLAVQKCSSIESMRVVFENCKFLHEGTLDKGDIKLEFTVMVQKTTGKFEIFHSDTIFATGRIFVPDETFNWPKVNSVDCPDNNDILKKSDIYKELMLRGYNYKGEFRRLEEYDIQNHIGKIECTLNWIAYIENMLQAQILEQDTRLLYIPTSIRRICIDNLYHTNSARNSKCNLMPVYTNVALQVIRSGGFEITGLKTTAISRKNYSQIPVLEKYVFVPNEAIMSLEESLMVNVQILIENTQAVSVKIVEIIDELVPKTFQPISTAFSKILQNIPRIRPNIKILTKEPIDCENIKIENKSIFVQTNCSLVIGTNLFQKQTVRDAAFKALNPNGFVISREKSDVDLNTPANNISILTTHQINNEKLILFSEKKVCTNNTIIKISSEDQEFSWLPKLQTAIKSGNNIILYSQNDPASGIIGLVNCARTEVSEANIKAFFILDDAPTFDPRHPFYSKQINKNFPINIYSKGVWGTYRHLSLEAKRQKLSEHCVLSSMDTRSLSSIKWVQSSLKSNMDPNLGKTFVKIHYAAVNYRDVKIASGSRIADVVTLDRKGQHNVLGVEFSGRTKDGRRVLGLASGGALSTAILADDNLLLNVPDNWSLKEAATVPAAYGVALYAFLKKTCLKFGESVLIHSGTSSVGQAAINVALALGCIIYTSVDTIEKRQYLLKLFPNLTEDNIILSRDSTFETYVMKTTNGRGVDVVLNTLSCDQLIASIRCLAKGGRFLQTEKFDLLQDQPLNLLLLKKDASFHSIMIDNILTGSNLQKAELCDLIQEGIDKGMVKPIPDVVFQSDQIEEAFRYISSAKYRGKILIQIQEDESVALPRKYVLKGVPKYYCDPNYSYVIFGGLGGFGIELCDWLVLRGCRNLIIASSRGVITGYQKYRIKIWKSYGCVVNIWIENPVTKTGIEALIAKAEDFGPVKAVFNLALILQDSMIENQTKECFKIAFNAKVTSTQYLDEVTREKCPALEDFVVFSSVTAGRGNAGQINYGMSNSIIERICDKRFKEGYPALAIQWGTIGEVGVVAKMQEGVQKEIQIRGTIQQRIHSCLEVLDIFLTNKTAAVVSSMVLPKKEFSTTKNNEIASAVVNILGIMDLKLVSFELTLTELGMDSMSAIQIKQTLEADFNIFLTPEKIRMLTLYTLQEIHREKTRDQD